MCMYGQLSQLKEKLAGETRHHYVDVRTMLDFEVEAGVAGCNSPPSGAVSFLLLHRGLGEWGLLDRVPHGVEKTVA